MLEIYKASAGSGKTYTLTHKYLDLLFHNENNDIDKFRHILAVTFTNKATDEMKQRILEELNKVASETKSKDKENAQKILIEILNDYNSFNIRTIDRFFQQVLRSFAREVGQYASYNVELDQESVLTEAVDSLMDSLDDTDNIDLLNYLIKLSIDSIESGKQWNPRPDLIALGKQLFSENYKLNEINLQPGWNDKENIDKYQEIMRDIVSVFESKARNLGKKGLSIISNNGLAVTDFFGGQNSALKLFEKLKNGIFDKPNASFRKLNEGGVDSYYSKGTPNNVRENIVNAYSDGLADTVSSVISLFDEDFIYYKSASVILRDLFTMGLLSDIDREIKSYCKKKNIILLSESTDFLNKIIDGSDTPFVYEKIGGRIDNYVLDEFQDTSQMQWDNFYPLIKDSSDQGFYNMIVGDVKQSIYRWRNSDWSLLNDRIYKCFKGELNDAPPLQKNWRSYVNIVEFNNDFFARACENLQIKYNNDTDTSGSLIKDIYKSLKQIPVQNEPGHVKVTFINKDESEEGWKFSVLQRLPSLISKLLSQGYSLNDITFLVRTNTDGAMLAEYLINNGFNVISEDSLLISSSGSVQKIVASLKYLSCFDDPISKFLFKGEHIENKEQSLYGICEEIIMSMTPQEREEGIFIQAFMDYVLNYITVSGSDISGFIKWWDEQGRKKSVSAPEGENSIKIMTIHKAKGLEFKVTVIPFMNEAFSRDRDKILWCRAKSEPFNSIPLLPIRLSSAINETIFSEEYKNEKLQSFVDALNLAYVSFTRAENELIIFSPLPKFKKDGSFSLSSTADLLYSIYNEKLNADKEYEIGDWSIRGEDDEKVKKAKAQTVREDGVFLSIPIGKRLSLSFSGKDYFSEDNMRNNGVILHEILSRISTEDELKNSINESVSEGLIISSQVKAIYDNLNMRLESVRNMHWFDGSFIHHNEATVIDSDGNMYRPDRVMIKDDRVVIVDYKFTEIRRSSYREQVSTYKSLMERMGFDDVSGYIWYLGDNTVEEV